MHESMHSFRRESPKDYRLIRNFVVDYLYAGGHDVMKMADNVKINYGDRLTTNEDCIEEIVCNSIMAIAGDESAMHKALQVAKADEGVLQKLANAIKNLASKIKEFIITHTTNEAAQAFVNDVKALDKLAEMFSDAADNIKAKSEEVITNEQKNNTDKGVESGDVKYSIKENVKNKVSGEIYDKVVVLDTNIFKGIPPRNWGKNFRNFISKHLIGKKFLTFDENGKEEIIEFAKPNERVTKNGANNSHKVIDKLSRKSDRNSKLVIVHSDEVINISEKQNENAKHSHQWLDENGWEFRNAFVMDKYGKIYSVTLNIAKSKDGRNILYDINKINEVGYGDVLSNAKGKRSSHINPNFVTNSISQSENNVNTKNDEKYSIGYTTDNNPVVVINDDILKGVKKSDWIKTVKNTISDKFSNGIPIKGRFIKVNRITRNEYTNSKYSKNKKNYDTVIYKDKFKTANNLDEIIIASTNYVNEDLKHTRKDSFKEFARGDVLIRVGSNDYSAKVIVGFTKGNEMVLYDIINFVPEKLDIKKIDTQYRPTTENVESDRTSVSITNSISENRNNVNTKNDESSNDIKYSMGGLKAETADKSALEKAMELEKDGTDSEKIRKETGWFKGYDGKWRFEIDNSELEFKTDIEKNRAAAIELAKMKVKSAELEEKIVNDTATKAEDNEYYNLDEKMIEYRKGVKLSDVINHPKLFEAYPQLKNVDVYYEISSVNRGVYSSNGNVIMLNPMHTIDEQKEAIIHEIQHAIQGIENFANGSNLEYWKNLGYSDEEAMAMYYNTAGEREARDVSARRDYNAEQRKNIRPDIDRKDVVFANNEYVKYSADEKSIEKYSDKEKENWQSSKNILIYRDNEQFEDFITKSLNNDINKKIYIGKISSKLGEFIYSKTGLNISGYNLVLRSSEIRKILKYDHGNEIKENLRGQRAIVKSDFLNFAKIITNPDEIYLGDKKFENKPVIIFVKTINGKTTAVTYVSAKHHDLTLQTMYSGKNKESLATTPSENKSLSQTSETLSGTASYKILAHEDNKVNIKENDNVSDIKYATDDTINDWLDDESTP